MSNTRPTHQPGTVQNQPIQDPLLDRYGIELTVKRLDLVHPLISGNKWFKLKYNLQAARQQGHDTLLSFGGAYSNHIHALAAAGKAYHFKTIGVIRGEPYHPLNPTLQFAVDQGMQLHYLNRADYRHKHRSDVIEQLHQQFGRFYLIPEGGSNSLAVHGCTEIIQPDDDQYDMICCAVATGATLAGLICTRNLDQQVTGIAVLKQGKFLYPQVRDFIQESGYTDPGNWQIQLDYHHRGYAKTTPELLTFIQQFEQRHPIMLDPVYTGKLLFALYQMIQSGQIRRGSRILAIHTGGLQGRAGFSKLNLEPK